jgi:hypothetical protein
MRNLEEREVQMFGDKRRGSRLLAVGLVALMTAFAFSSSALGDHVTPGEAGMTKVNIYDNTDNVWNVTTNDPVTGGPDPVIGFVNFRPTTPDDLTHVVVVVALKDGAPSCDYQIQLVTAGSDTGAGLPPDGVHSGFINVIGTLTTNAQGKGNTGAIEVDATALSGIAASGTFTYAHVDIEDPDANCVEADGTGVANNEYGASGYDPTVGPPPAEANIHWLQP